MTRPRSRTSSSGRKAQVLSRQSFSPYSCLRRLTLSAEGCSPVDGAAMNPYRSPFGSLLDILQKTRSLSFHNTSIEGSSSTVPELESCFMSQLGWDESPRRFSHDGMGSRQLKRKVALVSTQ